MRLLIVLLVLPLLPAGLPAAEKIDFNRTIRPLLSDRCFQCHGPDEKKRKADLRLDERAGVFEDRGGYAVIVPGKPEKSELIRKINSMEKREQMPPSRSGLHLSSKEKELIREWVAQGAVWEEHWAFQKPLRPDFPPVNRKDWGHNGIDRFVLARLEQEQLSPSEEADRETLIRRASFALTGLPPSPREMDDFLGDTEPGAYERLVDRLLASPRYGERMAQPWLEASRYADTDGYQNDRIRYMWAWRDWLLQSLNRNMPFDRFTIEQLAGDLLPNPTLYQQIATGFNRNHRINSEGGSIPAEFHVENVVDRVDTTATVWLGLTLGCARCHDHKFDPISQKEYYQLYGFFNHVQEWGLGPNNGNSPPFITLPKSWPFLAEEENKAILPLPYRIVKSQGAVQRPKPGGPKTVMVMHERKTPRKTFRLLRGAYDKPDQTEELQPKVPGILGVIDPKLPPNRLALAKWLVDPSNPLTARVTVNRLWQLHFGTGLVKTSENFGLQGESPSHSALLDWLATELIRVKWDMKKMHRLIVTSATFRQTSKADTALRDLDPENRLLARGPQLSLSGPMIRDQALTVSGLLVERMGGPSVKPYMPPGIWKAISNNRYKQDHGEKLYRRSLYTYWRRTIPPPTMITFGAAQRETCIVRKEHTGAPMQALTLMNNVTFVEASRLLAERMIKEGGNQPRERLGYGYRLLTSRAPRDTQLHLLEQALSTFRKRYKSDPEEAKKLLKVGEHPVDGKLKPDELAAYTMVANLLMNLRLASSY